MTERVSPGRFDPPEPGEPCRPCPSCPPGRNGKIPLARPRKKICHLCDKEKQLAVSGDVKRRKAAAARARAREEAKSRTKSRFDPRAATPAREMDKIREAYRLLDTAHRYAAVVSAPTEGLGGEQVVHKHQLAAALSELMAAYVKAADDVAPVLWPSPPARSADLARNARLVMETPEPPPS